MITIIDYGTGNLRSIANVLRVLGVPSCITSNPSDIDRATKLILPGVGHFDFGMTNLRQSALIEPLNDAVLVRKIPVLGICLGAQLLTRGSQEGQLPGLGWIEADTIAFDRTRMPSHLRVPHMGWADTTVRANQPLFEGLEHPRFYYVHSFHMVCDHPDNEMCHAIHGYSFVAGICKQHILGVQFHPEKSHRFGKIVLKNFAAWLPALNRDERE